MSERLYPRWIHHEDGRSIIVHNAEHENHMGEGWHDTPTGLTKEEPAAPVTAAAAEANPSLKGEIVSPIQEAKPKAKPGRKPKKA